VIMKFLKGDKMNFLARWFDQNNYIDFLNQRLKAHREESRRLAQRLDYSETNLRNMSDRYNALVKHCSKRGVDPFAEDRKKHLTTYVAPAPTKPGEIHYVDNIRYDIKEGEGHD